MSWEVNITYGIQFAISVPVSFIYNAFTQTLGQEKRESLPSQFQNDNPLLMALVIVVIIVITTLTTRTTIEPEGERKPRNEKKCPTPIRKERL